MCNNLTKYNTSQYTAQVNQSKINRDHNKWLNLSTEKGYKKAQLTQREARDSLGI